MEIMKAVIKVKNEYLALDVVMGINECFRGIPLNVHIDSTSDLEDSLGKNDSIVINDDILEKYFTLTEFNNWVEKEIRNKYGYRFKGKDKGICKLIGVYSDFGGAGASVISITLCRLICILEESNYNRCLYITDDFKNLKLYLGVDEEYKRFYEKNDYLALEENLILKDIIKREEEINFIFSNKPLEVLSLIMKEKNFDYIILDINSSFLSKQELDFKIKVYNDLDLRCNGEDSFKDKHFISVRNNSKPYAKALCIKRDEEGFELEGDRIHILLESEFSQDVEALLSSMKTMDLEEYIDEL